MSPHAIMKTKTQEKKVLTNAPMERPRTGSSNVGGGAGAGGGAHGGGGDRGPARHPGPQPRIL